MVVWLDATSAGAVLGEDIAADLDTEAFGVHVEAVKSYVEDRRPEFGGGDAGPYTPPQHVEVAATMLAYRCYLTRTSPASELGSSDDLARMLGIGRHRRFGFGGAA